MKPAKPVYHLFSRFGIEIEYMIVDRSSLSVKPIADRLIHAAAGAYKNEITRGSLAWSNELALHLVEMKTGGPVATLDGLGAAFLESVNEANGLLEDEEAMLLGSGMHPFMNPHSETKLWPHGYADIYKTFDRIFSCSRHGWANLQSMHVNLPFANDEEFGRLHAAIRLVLPIIPALAASSPLIENHVSGFSDTRLEVYRSNAMIVPSMTGEVIPEPVFSMHEYEEEILAPIYVDLVPYDNEGTLLEEWVNARGAIARFERNAIEIRLIDAQETPAADIAIAAAVIGAVKLIAQEQFSPLGEQKRWQVDPLLAILLDTIKSGEKAVVKNADYLGALGVTTGPTTAGDLWKHLINKISQHDPALIAPHAPVLQEILGRGTLSTRILASVGPSVTWKTIDETYRKLGECLRSGTLL
jgi:glutamate---cysteine ligase / carboxylate-amine ligase